MTASAPVAFVLGGGGRLGAYEVGMLRALVDHGVRPQLVVGTSVGAVNGAFVAARPDTDGVGELESLWRDADRLGVLSGSVVVQARNLLRTGVAVYTTDALGRLLARHLPAVTFADLAVHFECVATSIERAAEHWFADGPLVDAVLASAATPGLFPPVRIGAEHYVDGGVVNSIPVSRAVAHGARCIYVMHVGRVERPLTPPTRPWEVGFVAFELARRHRLAHDLAHLPPGVEVHLLPTGAARATRRSDLRYWDVAGTVQRMRAAYDASSRYLEAAAT